MIFKDVVRFFKMMNLIFQLKKKKKRKVQSFLFNLITVNLIMLEYLPLSTNRVKNRA